MLQAGATLPEGVIIDKNGQPTTNPKDYKSGGALLPAAGPKGYGLGLMAELIGGALLGKVEIEAGLGLNMLIILVDTKIFLPENMLGRLKLNPGIFNPELQPLTFQPHTFQP